jgi:hypothetical protein
MNNQIKQGKKRAHSLSIISKGAPNAVHTRGLLTPQVASADHKLPLHSHLTSKKVRLYNQEVSLTWGGLGSLHNLLPWLDWGVRRGCEYF